MANQRNDYTASGNALQKQHDNSPSVAINKHKAFLDPRLKQIEKWVRGGIRPEALVRFALMEMSTNRKLMECTPESVYLGLLACAVAGLEPGALKGECFLVPFAGKAQYMVGWRGIVKQARRSRDVLGLVANVIYEHDEFSLDLGTANTLKHIPATGDRGQVVGSYAIATMAGGCHEIEYLSAEDLRRIRAIADKRGPSPAWKDWGDQMARKSALRRLGKRLPLGDDFYLSQAIDGARDAGANQEDVINIVTDGAASASDAQLSASPKVDVPAEDYAFDPSEVPS